MRDAARALQRALRRDAGRARGADPAGRRADARPAGPDAQDVHDGRHGAGHRLRARRARRRSRKKFKRAQTDSGREIVRAAGQARRHQPDRDPRRRARRATRRTIEREFDGRGYGDLKTAVGDEVAAWLAPVRERYDGAARRRGGARGDAGRGRRERPRDRRAGRGRRARRDGGRARRAGPSGPPPSLRGRMASAVHRLELDLDVFAGPFDLLLSLILREDVDLLEVELADIVVSYLDHLEARDAARPRVRDGVPGADRGAAGAQVAADAARRGAARARRARARRGGRGAAGADAAVRALPRRRRAPGRAPRRRAGPPVPLRAAARGAAPRAAGRGRAGLRPGGAGRLARRAAAHAAADRPRATWRRRASRWPTGWRSCAGCCAAARSRSTTRSAAPTA